MLCAFALALPLAAHACPGCASALSKSLGSAFNASVLFMMAMPFTLFGAFVIGFIMLHRRNQKISRTSRNQKQTQFTNG
jgi:hypothetical protein